MLGVPLGTVKSRHSRAMDGLRAALEADSSVRRPGAGSQAGRPMSSRRMDATVDDWLRGTSASPYSAQRTVGQVMARVPSVPQRAGTTPGVPATIGRSRTMSSAVKFILASALLALTGGYLVIGPLTQRSSEEPACHRRTRRPRPHPPFDSGPTPTPSATAAADGRTDRADPEPGYHLCFPDEIPGRRAIRKAEDAPRTRAVGAPRAATGRPCPATSRRSRRPTGT